MTEQELLVDCLRRLNGAEIPYYLTLIWNKITPSDRQLGDAAGIFAVQTSKLDIACMEQWGEALDIAPELKQLLSGEIKPKRT